MENINLYQSVDDSNQFVNLLIDIYRNRPDYNPFTDYFVCRTGQYQYLLFYGDLEGDCTCLRYSGGQGLNYQLSVINYTDGVNVISQGYNYVGNIVGSSASASADSYRVNFITGIIILFCAVVCVYRLYKKKRDSVGKSPSLTVR